MRDDAVLLYVRMEPGLGPHHYRVRGWFDGQINLSRETWNGTDNPRLLAGAEGNVTTDPDRAFVFPTRHEALLWSYRMSLGDFHTELLRIFVVAQPGQHSLNDILKARCFGFSASGKDIWSMSDGRCLSSPSMWALSVVRIMEISGHLPAPADDDMRERLVQRLIAMALRGFRRQADGGLQA